MQVKVLTRLDFSDHHPLLISLNEQVSRRVSKSFKFECTWVLEDTYNDMINTTLDDNGSLQSNLKEVRVRDDHWNPNTVRSVRIM